MLEALLDFLLHILADGVAGPLRFIFSARYRAATRQRWARLSGLRVAAEIVFSLLCLAAVAGVIGVIVWAVVS